MSNKGSGSPAKRRSLKRTHHFDSGDEESFEPQSRPMAKRHREDPDLSDIATGYSEPDEDWSDIEKLFADKFEEKSPTSKLNSSFKHVGLKESSLLKQPKLSSSGRRTIGLTADERHMKRKHAMNRSLDFPKMRSRSPSSSKSPRRRHRSLSRSPKK